MHFTTFDGTTLSYVTIGKREQPPLLLIHGLGCDHLMWEPQLNHYYALGLFVIAPDVRGHGLSSPVTTFRVHDCARDVVILLDHLGIERAHLAGVSMGGLIVQQVACDFPERVDRLVIADSYSEVRTPTEKLGGWANWLTIKFFPDMFAQSLKAAYQGPQKERALNYMLKAYDRADSSCKHIITSAFFGWATLAIQCSSECRMHHVSPYPAQAGGRCHPAGCLCLSGRLLRPVPCVRSV